MERPKVIALSDIVRKRHGEALRLRSEHWFVAYWRLWEEGLDRLDDYLTTLKEMKMPLKDLIIETPANEPIVVATRDFAAPRRLVWKVMTEPEHVARWWGTEGQRNVITSFDVRPGGKWRIESHDPDGNVYIFIGEYREVTPPEKFVWTFGMENMFLGKTLIETHTFVEDGAITHYKSVSNYDSIADRDGMVASGMEKGMRHGFMVMDAILAELALAGAAR
jgi:uncharacterized protein YndB with AHSA1/START domain